MYSLGVCLALIIKVRRLHDFKLKAASNSFDVLRDVLITANMWQIADLESAILRHLVRVCSPEKCLKIFLFFNSSAGLFKDTMPDGAREECRVLPRFVL